MEMGYADPPTCLHRVCATAGTYSSFGTCERKKSKDICLILLYQACPSGCVACTDPGTCQGCKPGFYSLGTTCPGIKTFLIVTL